MYEDQHAPGRQGRPVQGHRCPACGNVDPDPQARFCGVCGTAMGTAAPLAGAPAPPVPYPAPGYPPPARVAPATQPVQVYAPASGQYNAPQALPRTVYAVPSVNLVGAAQIGAAISAVFGLIPCLLFAGFVAKIVSDLRWMLDSWITASFRVPVPVIAVDVPVNYIDLFRMRALYDFVVYWDDHIVVLFALLFLLPWIFSIISGALYGTTLAGIYNAVGATTGGVRVTLVPGNAPPPAPASSLQQAGWQPGPPPGPLQPPSWPNQGAPSQGWPNEPRR